MTFTCFTEGRHGGSQSRKQNTVPAAPFLAARDNDCAPRGREKGPLEELVQRALHGYESFSGRLGPQAAKNLPAGGGSLPPRRPHCAARSSAAGSGPPGGDQPCNAKKLGVAATKLRNQAGPGSSEFLDLVYVEFLVRGCLVRESLL